MKYFKITFKSEIDDRLLSDSNLRILVANLVNTILILENLGSSIYWTGIRIIPVTEDYDVPRIEDAFNLTNLPFHQHLCAYILCLRDAAIFLRSQSMCKNEIVMIVRVV